jgi:hypothetical protein
VPPSLFRLHKNTRFAVVKVNLIADQPYKCGCNAHTHAQS